MKGKAGFWIATVALLAPLPGESAVVPELAEQVKSGLAWIESSMDTESACTTQDEWYFRRVWLRLRPRAVFQLPALKLSLIPEVEILLERDYPDGWSAYKP
jgi:hypothetical protein